MLYGALYDSKADSFVSLLTVFVYAGSSRISGSLGGGPVHRTGYGLATVRQLTRVTLLRLGLIDKFDSLIC